MAGPWRSATPITYSRMRPSFLEPRGILRISSKWAHTTGGSNSETNVIRYLLYPLYGTGNKEPGPFLWRFASGGDSFPHDIVQRAARP